VLIALLVGFAPNVANPAQFLGTDAAMSLAFSGFTTTGLVLVAAALFLAAAMTQTGLDKRIALTILSRVGTGTRGVVVGTILVGFVIAYMVPSTTARVACLVPITLGIIAAFGVNKRGALASMLMITTVQTASIRSKSAVRPKATDRETGEYRLCELPRRLRARPCAREIGRSARGRRQVLKY
jgi:di/tricarboxylate transporter